MLRSPGRTFTRRVEDAPSTTRSPSLRGTGSAAKPRAQPGARGEVSHLPAPATCLHVCRERPRVGGITGARTALSKILPVDSCPCRARDKVASRVRP